MKNLKLSAWAAVLATAAVTTLPASATNILGIDVSSAQGSINWTTVHGNGVEFAFCHATTGIVAEDSTYSTNMTDGKAAGIQMGAYEISEQYANTPAQEANYFWNFAGGKIIKDGKSIDPAIWFVDFTGHDGATNYTAWFNSWAVDIKAKTANFMHPVIYSTPAGFCLLTTNIGLSAWVAEYNGENLYTGSPWSCCTSCNQWDLGGINNWTYWQVSDTGAIGGISGNVDLDAYNGTLAELKANEGVGE